MAECLRIILNRRWLLAIAVLMSASYLAASDVAAEVRNTGLAASAVDVHAAVTNNLMYLGYLVFVAFAFLVGDIVSRDAASGYGVLTLCRQMPRERWWSAKVAAIGVAAAVLQGGLLGCSILVARLLHGLRVTRAASFLALASAEEHRLLLFPPRTSLADPLGHQLVVAAYLALAFWALGSLLAVTSARWPALPPAGLALVLLMADYVLMKAWEPWRTASVGLRLLEGGAGPLGRTSALFGLALVAAIVLGRRLLRSAEL